MLIRVGNRLRRLVTQRPYVSLALGLAGLVVLGGWYNWHDAAQQNRQEQTALTRLAQERNKLQESPGKTAPRLDDAITEAQFADLSEPFKAPACSRLKNRKAITITSVNCDYTIRAFGKIDMAVVFVYDIGNALPAQATLTAPNETNPQSLAYINTYFKQQAARYKVSDPPSFAMSYYGPYAVTSPVRNLYYRDHGRDIITIFDNTAKQHALPAEKYDAVHYVLLDYSYGGIAIPWEHKAFTYADYATVPVFIHETLHLLGARDKYNNNDCSTIGTNDPFGRYNGTLPGSDIMCSAMDLNASKINDITAREIGWTN